jgi:hypothetical protein
MTVASDQYFLAPYNGCRLWSKFPSALQYPSPLINIPYRSVMSVASDQYLLTLISNQESFLLSYSLSQKQADPIGSRRKSAIRCYDFSLLITATVTTVTPTNAWYRHNCTSQLQTLRLEIYQSQLQFCVYVWKNEEEGEGGKGKLTFQPSSWYLNFIEWFMKNVSTVWTKKKYETSE